MKKITLCAAALLAVSAAAALAQTGNSYSDADAAKAKAALSAAGFTPGTVASAQGGALFVNATKGADQYVVTVLMADGSIHPGKPLGVAPTVPAAPMSLPPGSPAPVRAGRGGGIFSGGD